MRFEELLGALPIEVEPAPGRERWPILVSLAREHRLSAYDASYLELALRRGLPLATLDAQLLRALERSGAERLSIRGLRGRARQRGLDSVPQRHTPLELKKLTARGAGNG